ncbi:hypothetical protein LEMLEM_LOCUS3365 [Lemmus lemmus]
MEELMPWATSIQTFMEEKKGRRGLSTISGPLKLGVRKSFLRKPPLCYPQAVSAPLFCSCGLKQLPLG